ncbi:MAG: hypothetical protein AAFQ01_00780, partial [Bacteroidota bacterium]
MSKVVKMTLEEARRTKTQTDWASVDAMTDQEIEQAIKEDANSVPELTEAWFKRAHKIREGQQAVPVYVDHSVAEFLKTKNVNYHLWLNEMLKDFMRLTAGN